MLPYLPYVVLLLLIAAVLMRKAERLTYGPVRNLLQRELTP